MDREKVIKQLELIRDYDPMIRVHHDDVFKQYAIDALELLKAHELVNVKIYHDNGVTSWCVCGGCSATIRKGDKYCHECGRRLEWDG